MPSRKYRHRSPLSFKETFYICESPEDRCWVSHSLLTDQIGTGSCVVEALIDGMRAVDGLVALSQRDKTINVFRDAPKHILDAAKTAQELPKELYEIAHRQLYGDWPDDVKVSIDIHSDSGCFAVVAIEHAAV